MPADPPPNILVEGRDYTIDPAGRWIFSRSYLLARGRCCGSGCQNCPYPKLKVPARPFDGPPEHR